MSKKQAPRRRGSRRPTWLTMATVLASIAVETAFMRRRGYHVGLAAPVRCRDGHLFTTIWIPGASVKSFRLGTVGLQYCPVGRHFTVVRLVKDAELTDEMRSAALEHRDVAIP